MEKDPINILLDTNVLVSAATHAGKPKEIVALIISQECEGVFSHSILAEVVEILLKKFKFTKAKLKEVEVEINDNFRLVYPQEEIHVVMDADDDRILEAAIEGECDYIITGDKDLLELKKFRKIKIVTPSQFLEIFEKTSH